MRIYVAGPYSALTQAEVLENVHKAIEVGVSLLRLGHTPFIPHLTHWVEMQSQAEGYGLKYNDYMRWDDEWLKVCDGLFLIAASPGAWEEHEAAKARNLLIFYRLDEVPKRVDHGISR